eukprot:Skav225949  [mRNA]  locus=scaffold1500:609899:625227:- [translate_table: standard]
MQWNTWIFPVLFSIIFQNLDASSLELWCAVTLFSVATLSREFGRLVVKHRGALYLRATSLYRLGLLDTLRWSDACGYTLASLTVLGTIQCLLVTWRIWPELLVLADLESVPSSGRRTHRRPVLVARQVGFHVIAFQDEEVMNLYTETRIRSDDDLQCLASVYCNSSDHLDLHCSRQEALSRAADAIAEPKADDANAEPLHVAVPQGEALRAEVLLPQEDGRPQRPPDLDPDLPPESHQGPLFEDQTRGA